MPERRRKGCQMHMPDGSHRSATEAVQLAAAAAGDEEAFRRLTDHYSVSSLPMVEKGEQFPRVICILTLLCSHYKMGL